MIHDEHLRASAKLRLARTLALFLGAKRRFDNTHLAFDLAQRESLNLARCFLNPLGVGIGVDCFLNRRRLCRCQLPLSFSDENPSAASKRVAPVPCKRSNASAASRRSPGKGSPKLAIPCVCFWSVITMRLSAQPFKAASCFFWRNITL
jgi:hypothetical protein